MVSKHTPGPWRYDHFSHGYYMISQDGDNAQNREWGYIAKVQCHTPDEKKVLANARLMAAAPELLEACKAAIEWVALDGDHISEPIRSQLKAAIAKATGATNDNQ